MEEASVVPKVAIVNCVLLLDITCNARLMNIHSLMFSFL